MKKKNYQFSIVFLLCFLFIVNTVSAQTQFKSVSGKVTSLDIRDVGIGYGPQSDHIDAEIIIHLNHQKEFVYGFQLRTDEYLPARKAMFDLIKLAYKEDWTITIDFTKETGKKNYLMYAIRVKK